jgi:hypothetical protein
MRTEVNRERPESHQAQAKIIRYKSSGTGAEQTDFWPAKPQARRVEGGESACRPGSVPRLRGATVIHLGLPLPTASCGLPSGIGRAALKRPRGQRLAARAFLTLLRVGFTKPPQSPAALVVSYTTVSPLPR